MNMTADKLGVYVIRMADKFAKSHMDMRLIVSGDIGTASGVEINSELPDELTISGADKPVCPSIISSPSGATIKFDGTVASTYIPNRCNSMGCSSADKAKIVNGTVPEVDKSGAVEVPPL